MGGMIRLDFRLFAQLECAWWHVDNVSNSFFHLHCLLTLAADVRVKQQVEALYLLLDTLMASHQWGERCTCMAEWKEDLVRGQECYAVTEQTDFWIGEKANGGQCLSVKWVLPHKGIRNMA